MMLDKHAMAGLFDAFVFLAIAALVSVSLLTALSPSAEKEGDGQQQVESTLTVVLRSTVRDGDGNSRSVQETLLSSGGADNGSEEHIARTLDLLLPGWEWRWTVHRADGDEVLSNSDEQAPGAVHCSIAHSTFQGQAVEYRLEAWRS